MIKPLRWIFTGLVAMSLLLLLATVGMWMVANSGYGSRVLCIATPGTSVWRIRLDNPLTGRVSRFGHWPTSRPAGFAVRYVADNSQSPMTIFNAPGVELTPTSRSLAGDFFTRVSGPAVLSANSGSAAVQWDSILIVVSQALPIGDPGAGPAAKFSFSLSMISFSYIWAMEIFGILPLVTLFILLRRAAMKKATTTAGFCGNCGYDLRATPDRCPECGTVPRSSPENPSA